MHICLRSENCFKRKRLSVYLALFISFYFTIPAFTQITVTASSDPTQLVQNIMGKGYVVSNAKMTCPDGAAGIFTSITSNIG